MVQSERDLGGLQSSRLEVRRRHGRGSSFGKLRMSTQKLVRLGELVRSLYHVVNWGRVEGSLDRVPSEARLRALYPRYISDE